MNSISKPMTWCYDLEICEADLISKPFPLPLTHLAKEKKISKETFQAELEKGRFLEYDRNHYRVHNKMVDLILEIENNRWVENGLNGLITDGD
ncbi:835_t:CDS:2 [Gigaspora rosea]|nr:835_t:CDS:2 [Gigaspora rosea]